MKKCRRKIKPPWDEPCRQLEGVNSCEDCEDDGKHGLFRRRIHYLLTGKSRKKKKTVGDHGGAA